MSGIPGGLQVATCIWKCGSIEVEKTLCRFLTCIMKGKKCKRESSIFIMEYPTESSDDASQFFKHFCPFIDSFWQKLQISG